MAVYKKVVRFGPFKNAVANAVQVRAIAMPELMVEIKCIAHLWSSNGSNTPDASECSQPGV